MDSMICNWPVCRDFRHSPSSFLCSAAMISEYMTEAGSIHPVWCWVKEQILAQPCQIAPPMSPTQPVVPFYSIACTASDAGMKYSLLRLPLSLLIWPFVHADSDYNERLNLQPLTPASLLASFNFWSNASLQSYEQQHFKYIPRSLGQILQHANTRELHLRFSTGRWDDESWGSRPWGGMKEGGTGVELWAWVEADSEAR